MPRPMLRTPGTKQETGMNHMLSATMQPAQKNKQQQMNKMQLDRMLRQRRSQEYMDALRSLDAGGHVMNQQKAQRIIDALRKEFPEVNVYGGILLGYVARCYLGHPYEVHCLDFTGEILEHYKRGQVLPDGMEKARGIAMHGSYEFIEVYADCCRAISSDGSVAVIPC